MRFLTGVIVGILLTVVTALIHDNNAGTADTATIAQRPMVNWEVVRANVTDLSAWARQQWTKLTSDREKSAPATPEQK